MRAAACVVAGAWDSPLATAKALRTVALQSHGGETVSYKYITCLVRFEFLAVCNNEDSRCLGRVVVCSLIHVQTFREKVNTLILKADQ